MTKAVRELFGSKHIFMRDVDFIAIISDDGVVQNSADQQSVWVGMYQLSEEFMEKEVAAFSVTECGEVFSEWESSPLRNHTFEEILIASEYGNQLFSSMSLCDVVLYQALVLRYPEGVKIPCRETVRKIMRENNLNTPKKRKPNGITKSEREAQKSDNKIQRDFTAEQPFVKGVTDITEVPARDGKLYVSAIFDCFDAEVVGLSMDDNTRADLCVRTLSNAVKMHPELREAIIHSDRGSQYTSVKYRTAITRFSIVQSMNGAGGRYHDNAKCESMWAKMKEELFYSRNRKSENYSIEEL